MDAILDSLVKKNEYPIVFIGSGMPKRFLNDFPNWITLLEEFWTKIGRTNFCCRYLTHCPEVRLYNYIITTLQYKPPP